MTLWLGVLLASAAVYSWKIFGYLVPEGVLHSNVMARIASLLTVALLSGLVGIQTLVSNQQISIDARIPAVLIGVVLLRLKQPFIVVVCAGAAVAALIRLF
jgi:branched-subunit amino acid transport protein